jgi:hypothetical protein
MFGGGIGTTTNNQRSIVCASLMATMPHAAILPVRNFGANIQPPLFDG